MRAIILVFFGLLALAIASTDKKVVCYFGSWSVYRKGKGQFDIGKINPNLCTHLIYSFAGLNEDGTIRILDPWADLSKDGGKNGYGKVNNLRLLNPSLKTMIAMGGWNEGSIKYSRVMSNPSLRSRLVQSIVEFVEMYKFDGFDLDWEYPADREGAPKDKKNLIVFLKELRKAFEPKGLILSAAVGASPARAETSYNIAEMAQNLDFINMMEYDFHGSWEKSTGHNAPLYAEKNPNDKSLNVDASIQHWLKNGAPAEKLIMGIPFYARGFTLTDPSNYELNSPTTGGSQGGPYTQAAGMLGYNEICENMDQWEVEFDEKQLVPYAHYGNQWISFDNEKSIEIKADYVTKYGLGGMMVWSLETDDFRGVCGESWPLLKAINRALNGKSGSSTNGMSPTLKPKKNKKTEKHQKTKLTSPKYQEVEPSPPEHTFPSEESNKPVLCTSPSDYIRDSRRCDVYYMCQPLQSGGYMPIQMFCPPSLVFNTASNNCDYKENVPGC